MAYLSDYFPEQPFSALLSIGQQHNEHRIVYTRFLAWMCAKLTGQVNFGVLAIIGNSSLLVLTLLLLTLASQKGLRDFWLIPIPALLLACIDPSNSLIAMYGLQNYTVHLFAALAFACWKTSRLLGAAFAILSAWTSSCGLLVLPILVIYEFYRFIIIHKNFHGIQDARSLFKANWKLLLVTVLVWIIYFWGYSKPSHHPSLLICLFYPMLLVKFVLITFGMYFYPLGLGVIYIVGSMFLVLLAYVLLNSGWTRNFTIISLLLFEIATVLAIAISRSGFGHESALSSRYLIITSIAWSCVYVLAATILNRYLTHSSSRVIGMSMAVLAVSFNLLSADYNSSNFSKFSGQMKEQLSPSLSQANEIGGEERFYQIALRAQSKGLFNWSYLSKEVSPNAD